MIGLGMIFDETYRPVFEQLRTAGLFRRDFGLVEVELTAVASRTGARVAGYRASGRLGEFASFTGTDATAQLLGQRRRRRSALRHRTIAISRPLAKPASRQACAYREAFRLAPQRTG